MDINKAIEDVTGQYTQNRDTLKIERVAAYVRVSTTEQKLHGLSLDAQRMKLEQYAKAHNMRIIEWYVDEGVSGRKLIKKRPELQRMIIDAEQGKFDRIIFIKLDRFFRSVAEYHECMKRIAPVVWTTTEEQYDLTTANGRMLVNMKLTVAELEADQTGERIRLVNDYKLSTGRPLTGSMPFGFAIEKDEQGHRKRIIRDPETEDILREAIDFCMTHQSKRKTVMYLNAKHHVSLSYNSFSNLMANTMLYGSYHNNQNFCEAYMTKEEFDRLQEVTTSRHLKENTTKARTYLFSGLILCPDCGNKMSGGIFKNHVRGKVYLYKRYRCLNHKINNRCNNKKTVNENVLERMMLENVEKYLEDAKVRAKEIKDGDSLPPKHNIEDINAEIDRLNYSWKTGKIRKVEQYEKDYDTLMQRLEEAERELGNTKVKDFSEIEKILHDGWREIYNKLDDEHKRAFWRSFIRSIEIEWTTEIKRIVRVNFF